MSLRKPMMVKPGSTDNKDRFQSAAEFAASTEKTPAPESKDDLVRENWDTSIDTKRKIKMLVANSRMFKNKREFLEQCVRDGLEKYKDK
ncbi:hypothetical protein KPE71_13890 [Acinetobacter soli]|uniref:hypothetical protein n=1 Tax=Acinetobacter soli TaxID=487316 RepID=UPI001C0D926A|nr:hypothetical protein [Acinetobacter soli]MBU3121345.1 hypothetical protein [Acinetobacter soli]